MQNIRAYSIRKRLTLMNMLASGSALLLACAAFAFFQVESIRGNMVRELSIEAQIVGANTSSALTFTDPEAATNTLSALSAARRIVFAGVFTAKGALLAQYERGSAGIAHTPPLVPQGQQEISRFGDSGLELVRRIVFNGKYLGTVYIVSDMRELNEQLARFAAIVAAVLLMSLLAAFVLSSIFQGATARPIIELAEIARIVSRQRIYTVRAPPTRNQDEIAVLVEAFNEMLTQIRERDTALRKSEERYRLISEISSDYAYALDVAPGGALVCEWATEPFTRITGFTVDEINQKGWYSLFHPDDIPAIEKHHRVLVPTQTDFQEARIVTRDNDVRWVRVYRRLVLSEPESGQQNVIRIYGAALDITIEKNLERQLLDSRKMEAIGRLAGGVAHDFNNLLTIISGYSELLHREAVSSGKANVEYVDAVLRAAGRAAQLTGQLLAFSRRQVLQPKVIDLRTIVTDIEKLLKRLTGDDVELRFLPGPRAGLVKVDPGQIEQVIMNLAINARDAMPDGGCITIETTDVDLDTDAARQHAVPAGSHAVLSVTDTGVGMDPETISHIFEPFFTTKEMGKGTGLGLAMVYGIVRQSGGDISVESEPDKGTTFRIFLPRLADSEAPAAPSQPAAAPDNKGSETILVLEDEVPVRDLIRRVLTDKGYTVLSTDNGEDALRLCAEHPGQISLTVADVLMPRMNGPQIVDRILKLQPKMRILYISGYADQALSHEGVERQGAAFLEKPFLPDALARVVREVLDS